MWVIVQYALPIRVSHVRILLQIQFVCWHLFPNSVLDVDVSPNCFNRVELGHAFLLQHCLSHFQNRPVLPLRLCHFAPTYMCIWILSEFPSTANNSYCWVGWKCILFRHSTVETLSSSLFPVWQDFVGSGNNRRLRVSSRWSRSTWAGCSRRCKRRNINSYQHLLRIVTDHNWFFLILYKRQEEQT